MYVNFLIVLLVLLFIVLNVSNAIISYSVNHHTIKISPRSFYNLDINDQNYFKRAFCITCKYYLDFYYFNPHIELIEFQCKKCNKPTYF